MTKLHMCDLNGEYQTTIDFEDVKGFGLPANSTRKPLPEVQEGHRLYLVDGEWESTWCYVGRPYWNAEGEQFTVEKFNSFVEGMIIEQPPEAGEHEAVRHNGESWGIVPDYRGEVAHPKNPEEHEGMIIEEVGALPATHTLKEPIPFSLWVESEDEWVLSDELKRDYDSMVERGWRDETLRPIIDRINQYQSDMQKPEAFRRTPYTEEQYMALLTDYTTLCDYPATPEFPYGTRPVLSELA